MATIVLQVVGAAIGGAVGGPVGASIGRAVGAAAGYAIDQKLFVKDQLIRGGRLEDSRYLASGDGAPIPKVYGRVRMGGHLIWATRFEESRRVKKRGGKGGPSVKTEEFSYFGNFAIGICEGELAHLGRIWADGKEIDQTKHTFRFYEGDDEQLPDPLIEAKQGYGRAPAFRNTAYVVFEDFPLADYGNRIPQFSFEVIRSIAKVDRLIKSVNLIPGATEFGYSPQDVSGSAGGVHTSENRHNFIASSNWQASLDELQNLCPELESVSLVVSWFGNDLRVGSCSLTPKIVHDDNDRAPWQVAGLTRSSAQLVSKIDGKPSFGGTPSDQSVLDAIVDLKARGLKVTLYPFIMMDIAPGNQLPDPYGDAEQAAFPWRGRLTCFPAPEIVGTANKTAVINQQVSDFFGNAEVADFDVAGGAVAFTGDPQWSLRRMILHYANLVELAGGVDKFIIGSEMRGLTTLRNELNEFPAVSALETLAVDIRQIVAANTLISYAADWSEYFGYHPTFENNDVYFHLDPLWASPAIDAVAIDNYMPLSDWHGEGDPGAPNGHSIHSLDYLKSNICGGEGKDWYYASMQDRLVGNRTPITDGLGEPWVWSYKDLVSWWSELHHNRIDGVRSQTATAWSPQSKPIWFTEFGCPAINRGSNQPNVFYDQNSSESQIPWFSKGGRDDLIQLRSLQAQCEYWADDSQASVQDNPSSAIYSGRMVKPFDMSVWAWDARPYPAFPHYQDIWSDGENWYRGHWLNGRIGTCPLDDVLAAICDDFGLDQPICETDGHLQGLVISGETSARAVVEPLLLLHNIAVGEEDEKLVFTGKNYLETTDIALSDLVHEENENALTKSRLSEIQLPREISISHGDVDNGFDSLISTSRRLETSSDRQMSIEVPVVIGREKTLELSNARLRDIWNARDTAQFKLTWKHLGIVPGDLVSLSSMETSPKKLQVQSTVDGNGREMEAVGFSQFEEFSNWIKPITTSSGQTATIGRPDVLLMNLPLNPVPEGSSCALYAAAFASPWAGQYAVMSSPAETGFERVASLTNPALIFELVEPLEPGVIGRWDYQQSLKIRTRNQENELQSSDEIFVLSGENAVAIKCVNDEWEILQFKNAEIISPNIWELKGLLRGQLGTDVEMKNGAAIGAQGVLIDDAILAIPVLPDQIGLPFNWKIGPTNEDLTSSSYHSETLACLGRELRHFSPCHLKAKRIGQSIELSWIRRSRLNSDNWQLADIPLDSAIEKYRLEIITSADEIIRTIDVAQPGYVYSDLAADFSVEPEKLTFKVSQLSNTLEPGSPAILNFTL